MYGVNGIKYYYTRVRDKETKLIKDNDNTFIIVPTDDIRIALFFFIPGQQTEQLCSNKTGLELYEFIKNSLKVILTKQYCT